MTSALKGGSLITTTSVALSDVIGVVAEGTMAKTLLRPHACFDIVRFLQPTLFVSE